MGNLARSSPAAAPPLGCTRPEGVRAEKQLSVIQWKVPAVQMVKRNKRADAPFAAVAD